jgi:hypothetical protein
LTFLCLSRRGWSFYEYDSSFKSHVLSGILFCC